MMGQRQLAVQLRWRGLSYRIIEQYYHIPISFTHAGAVATSREMGWMIVPGRVGGFGSQNQSGSEFAAFSRGRRAARREGLLLKCRESCT